MRATRWRLGRDLSRMFRILMAAKVAAALRTDTNEHGGARGQRLVRGQGQRALHGGSFDSFGCSCGPRGTCLMRSMTWIVKTLYGIVNPFPEKFVKTLYNIAPEARTA